jgi:hypothetical protein
MVRLAMRVAARYSADARGGRRLARAVVQARTPKRLQASLRLAPPRLAPSRDVAPQRVARMPEPALPAMAPPSPASSRPAWAPAEMSDFAAQWMFGDEAEARASLISMQAAEKLPEPTREQRIARFLARGGLERSRGAEILEGPAPRRDDSADERPPTSAPSSMTPERPARPQATAGEVDPPPRVAQPQAARSPARADAKPLRLSRSPATRPTIERTAAAASDEGRSEPARAHEADEVPPGTGAAAAPAGTSAATGEPPSPPDQPTQGRDRAGGGPALPREPSSPADPAPALASPESTVARSAAAPETGRGGDETDAAREATGPVRVTRPPVAQSPARPRVHVARAAAPQPVAAEPLPSSALADEQRATARPGLLRRMIDALSVRPDRPAAPSGDAAGSPRPPPNSDSEAPAPAAGEGAAGPPSPGTARTVTAPLQRSAAPPLQMTPAATDTPRSGGSDPQPPRLARASVPRAGELETPAQPMTAPDLAEAGPVEPQPADAVTVVASAPPLAVARSRIATRDGAPEQGERTPPSARERPQLALVPKPRPEVAPARPLIARAAAERLAAETEGVVETTADGMRSVSFPAPGTGAPELARTPVGPYTISRELPDPAPRTAPPPPSDASPPGQASAGLDLEAAYEYFLDRFKRDLVVEREQTGHLLNDNP